MKREIHIYIRERKGWFIARPPTGLKDSKGTEISKEVSSEIVCWPENSIGKGLPLSDSKTAKKKKINQNFVHACQTEEEKMATI